MKIDVTLKITSDILNNAYEKDNKALVGHVGTHFDVMNKEFPLDYTERNGIIFDVSKVKDRDIDICDIEIDKITKDTFVAFYSGYIEEESYGTKKYFSEHPQLSNELLEKLIEKRVSVIGVDFAGVRRGKEHTPMDQHCADNGVFVVENLCNLGSVLKHGDTFTAHTYPMNYTEITGLPCRVVFSSL